MTTALPETAGKMHEPLSRSVGEPGAPMGRALIWLASLGLAFNMLGAIMLVHLKAGFFAPAGFEYPLVLLAASAGLVLMGPGAFSVDAQLARRRDRLPLAVEPALNRRAA